MSQVYLDLEGKPVALRTGVHQRKFKRDARGRLDGRAALDVQGGGVIDRLTGCFAEVQIYDSRGLQIGVGCIGTDGKPRKSNLGFSIMVRDLDEKNRPKQDRFLEGEQPVETVLGVHEIRYDWQGNKFVRYLFDSHGGPPQGNAGGDVSEYDARGFLTMEAQIDHEGRLWNGTSAPLTRYTWDGGVIREVRHLSAHQEPALEKGIHLERRTYDDLSQLVKRECFGVEGAPVVCAAFRVITFRIQGELLGKQAPFSKERALALAKQVKQEISAGEMTMDRAFRKYDPDAMTLVLEEAPRLTAAWESLTPRFRKILDGLPKGQVSEPDVSADEVMLVERIE